MIQGVFIKKLRVIRDNRGYVMEILRSDDTIFEKFGQVYLSTCNPGIVKGWHYHKKQTDYLTVIKGNAKVVLYDMRENSKTKGEINEFFVGEKNPILIKIPPLVAHGVTPIDNKPIYIINTTTELYNYKNPDEGRLPFNTDKIKYKW